MCQNKFERFLLEMHDKIIHNPKICLELRGHSVTPIRPRHYLSILGWSNRLLGVDIDHFENHWFKLSLMMKALQKLKAKS